MLRRVVRFGRDVEHDVGYENLFQVVLPGCVEENGAERKMDTINLVTRKKMQGRVGGECTNCFV